MAAFGGLIAGTLIFSATIKWLGSLWELRRTKSSTGVMVGFSAFHSGPWLLVAFGIFTYFVYPKPWWPWFMSGFAINALMLIPAIMFVVRAKRRGNAV